MDKLIVSSKSWHYRLYRFTRSKMDSNYQWYVRRGEGHFHDPKTLCAYFWANVGNTLRFILCGVCAVILAVGGIGFLPALLWSAFHNHSISAQTALTILLLLAVLMAVIFVLVTVKEALTAYIERKSYESAQEGLSGVGVVVQITKAAKSKVCPLIEYKD